MKTLILTMIAIFSFAGCSKSDTTAEDNVKKTFTNPVWDGADPWMVRQGDDYIYCFSANANYPDSTVEAIAVSAAKNGILVNEPVKPCGACRQALAESEVRFETPNRIILDGQDSILILQSVESLLPLSFSKKDLASPNPLLRQAFD